MNKTFIIAELSANHNHDKQVALDTIRAAKRCGADAVKIQTYTADTMTIDSNWKIQCKLPPKTKRFCPLVLK